MRARERDFTLRACRGKHYKRCYSTHCTRSLKLCHLTAHPHTDGLAFKNMCTKGNRAKTWRYPYIYCLEIHVCLCEVFNINKLSDKWRASSLAVSHLLLCSVNFTRLLSDINNLLFLFFIVYLLHFVFFWGRPNYLLSVFLFLLASRMSCRSLILTKNTQLDLWPPLCPYTQFAFSNSSNIFCVSLWVEIFWEFLRFLVLHYNICMVISIRLSLYSNRSNV